MTGNVRPRNFALLLFGYRPQRFVPGAVSIYSRYPGLDRSDPTARRFEYAGTLLEQLDHLEHRLEQELEMRFDKTDFEHPNAEKYPLRALREAMVNALTHRDYTLPDPTRLASFADRIEVVSPGSLPLGVSIDDLRRRTPTPRWRNQCLAWFLNRMQLAQAEGQGLVTIRRTMKALGCPPPRFKANEAYVQCVLPANRRFTSSLPRK